MPAGNLADYFRRQIEDAVLAVTMYSPHAYSWLGELPVRIPREFSPAETRRRVLHSALQSELYTGFYCNGFAAANPPHAASRTSGDGDPSFLERLSSANAISGCWEDDWIVADVVPGGLIAARDGLRLHVRSGEFRIGPPSSLQVGCPVSLLFPGEYRGTSPGFYAAASGLRFPLGEAGGLVRLYWNLRPEAALEFVRRITSALHDRIPFGLKVVNDPGNFRRCDVVVLYIRKPDYAATSSILQRIYTDLESGIRRRVPALTRPLLPGLGLAEDPPDGESFGFHRCGLLADALICAYERGQRTLSERLTAVMERFREEEIRVDAPFLNPGSADDYDGLVMPSRSARRPNSDTAAPDFCVAASEIGNRLAREAFWHADTCTWLGFGRQDRESTFTTGVTGRTLGPELYEGTSGVGLFLAELYRVTDNPLFRDTARGALCHALARAESIPAVCRFGLFTGMAGIAFAAARAGMLLADDDLLESAAALLGKLRTTYTGAGDVEYDLLSGLAGTIAVILTWPGPVQHAAVTDFAVRLGNDLVKAARKSGRSYSWGCRALPHQRHLTGFSHGTAGIAYALLELYRVTGIAGFRQAAEGAFYYERKSFDPRVQSWPDLRAAPAHAGGRRVYPNSWCHGAPGIVLSRLRAYELLADADLKEECLTGIHTVRVSLETVLEAGTGNFSLCHGVAGNAEVLMEASRVLGEQPAANHELARKTGLYGIRNYLQPREEWPCGGVAGETPGLMLGLSGIGLFYLRLHDPAVPSALILRPRENRVAQAFS